MTKVGTCPNCGQILFEEDKNPNDLESYLCQFCDEVSTEDEVRDNG